MYRPRFHPFRNPHFNQWSPHLSPRGPFLQRNFATNRYRPPGSQTIQNNHEFWCETCDKGFQTSQILENHKTQHQKCNIDGCQFVAHPKVITKHIQMQHSTGLYKKIANLNNPEDIQKWREERKRKYPTKENIQKKAAEVKEKFERGEKMGMKYGANNKRHIKGQTNRVNNLPKQKFTRGKTQRHNFKMRHSNTLNPPAPKRICKIKPKEDEVCRLQAFAGIQQLVIEDERNQEDSVLENSLIEDDILTEELTINENIPKTEPTVCEALSSLICNYGSSDEDVVTENPCPNNYNKCQKDSKANNLIEENKKLIVNDAQPVCINNNVKTDDDSGPEEIVTKKEEIQCNILNTICDKDKTNKIVKNIHVNSRQIKKPKYRLPSTLLVKLLSREIEHERNLILQCVRYVVKNNYFEDVDIKE